jgi:uncharacterized protein (DUF302 family)
MFYCVDSDKSFYEATVDLEAVILRHGYAILHADDLGELLRSKSSDYDEECKVYDLFHPHPVGGLLVADGRLGAALPTRISVFTDNGVTRLAAVRPTHLLPSLSPSVATGAAGRELEDRLVQMIDEAR